MHPFRYLPLVLLAAAAPTEAPYSGNLSLALRHLGPPQFVVSATFRVGPPPDWTACPGTPVDNCCYEDEDIRRRHPPAESALVDAGHLAFAHNNTALGVMAPPATGRPYASLSTPSINPFFYWLPGETLRVRGSGGTVHAFDGTMIVPPSIAGITPDIPPYPGNNEGGAPGIPTPPMQIPRGRPFVIAWTPYAGARMTLSLTGMNAHGLTGWITCGVSDTTGQAVISTEVLARFADADTAGINLTRTVTATPQKTADNAAITIFVQEMVAGRAVFVDTP